MRSPLSKFRLNASNLSWRSSTVARVRAAHGPLLPVLRSEVEAPNPGDVQGGADSTRCWAPRDGSYSWSRTPTRDRSPGRTRDRRGGRTKRRSDTRPGGHVRSDGLKDCEKLTDEAGSRSEFQAKNASRERFLLPRKVSGSERRVDARRVARHRSGASRIDSVRASRVHEAERGLLPDSALHTGNREVLPRNREIRSRGAVEVRVVPGPDLVETEARSR